MTWAGERRIIVLFVVGAVLAAFAGIIFISVFYKTPTCTDGIKDGSETGLDCGGTCPYLCSADENPPTILFTQALNNGEGRTDVIALVENKNQDAAAKDILYTITVYGYDQSLIQSVSGTFELPPGATVPVFVPGVASGRATVGTAFLRIDGPINWYTVTSDPRTLPGVSGTSIGGTANAPRITATLGNPDVRPMTDVKAIVLVKDGAGNAIAASQTVVPVIPPQGSATATFTWNSAFPGAPVQVQVLPLVPLP